MVHIAKPKEPNYDIDHTLAKGIKGKKKKNMHVCIKKIYKF